MVRLSRYARACCEQTSTFLCMDIIVTSSACEVIMSMCGGSSGMSCMYKLNSVGDRTEPWGTPLGKFSICDDLQL